MHATLLCAIASAPPRVFVPADLCAIARARQAVSLLAALPPEMTGIVAKFLAVRVVAEMLAPPPRKALTCGDPVPLPLGGWYYLTRGRQAFPLIRTKEPAAYISRTVEFSDVPPLAATLAWQGALRTHPPALAREGLRARASAAHAQT
jgi:hypothetical protein